MATIEYMTRGFVHIPESPPESRWLRLRGPPVENLDLTGGPTTQEEIWQMRYNRQLLSLLVEIWLNEYREGWSVDFSIIHLPYFYLFLLQNTHNFLLAARKLFRIESPFFDVTDVFNNGEMVPHYRSVVVFARFAPNEAWGMGAKTKSVGKNKKMELDRWTLSCRWRSKRRLSLNAPLANYRILTLSAEGVRDGNQDARLRNTWNA